MSRKVTVNKRLDKPLMLRLSAQDRERLNFIVRHYSTAGPEVNQSQVVRFLIDEEWARVSGLTRKEGP